MAKHLHPHTILNAFPKLHTSAPVAESQIFTRLSDDAVTIRAPSAENLTWFRV